MNTIASASRPVRRHRGPGLLNAAPLVLAAILGAGLASARAQALLPTAPPAPAATPGNTDLTAYRLARRPTVSTAIAFPASGVPTQNLATTWKAGALPVAGLLPTILQPHTVGGVFSEINLGLLQGANPPPPATVTLQFDPANAGALVWVQALDGGTLQAQDPSGNPVKMGAGGWIQLDPTGQMSFTFQVPAASARYQVLVRLDNVSSVLPFVVPDPTLN